MTLIRPRPTSSTDNVTSVTNAKSEKAEYTYNTRRQVLTTKDARGKVTENVYDPMYGTLLSTKDAHGTVTSYEYDRGQVKLQAVTVDGEAITTRYEYAYSGDLRKETNAANEVTEYEYDFNGNRRLQRTSRTLPGGSTESIVSTYTYDNSGRLTHTTDADNQTTRTVYDAAGRQTKLEVSLRS